MTDKTESETKTSELPISRSSALSLLFSEELGMVIEYMPENEDAIASKLSESGVPFQVIGKTTREKRIRISRFTIHY